MPLQSDHLQVKFHPGYRGLSCNVSLDFGRPGFQADIAETLVARVRALEEAGVISGYRAQVDARKLGLTLMALLHISMDKHTPERFANFEQKIAALPEVIECLLVTGQEADYQLKVIVRDMDAYQDLLLNRITRIEGVTGVHTSFVLRRALDKAPMPA